MSKKIILLDPNRTFAGKPIGNYNPNNDAFNKRKPNPDPLDLNKKIDWSKLINKLGSFHSLNLFELIENANKADYIIVPNSCHDFILTDPNLVIFQNSCVQTAYPAWTGTLVIYNPPDVPFADKLVYSSKDPISKVTYSLNIDIPEKFIGKQNCVLVIEHPDFDIIQLKNNSYKIKANEEKLCLLENFPKEEGWYHTDPKFIIPTGEKIPLSLEIIRLDRNRRHLIRSPLEYIGLLARGPYITASLNSQGSSSCSVRADVEFWSSLGAPHINKKIF